MSSLVNNTNNTQATFVLDEDNMSKAKEIIARYPVGRQQSAVLPILDIAQRQNGGYLSRIVLDYIAYMLDMPPIKVYEVATFYSMFNLKPVGKHFIQVCRTTPCWLRGSDKLSAICKSKLGIGKGEMTADGQFSFVEVECLGACVNAPMIQINDNYYEDLTPEQMEKMIDDLKAGKEIKVGTQTKRLNSAPESGMTVLKTTLDK